MYIVPAHSRLTTPRAICAGLWSCMPRGLEAGSELPHPKSVRLAIDSSCGPCLNILGILGRLRPSVHLISREGSFPCAQQCDGRRHAPLLRLFVDEMGVSPSAHVQQLHCTKRISSVATRAANTLFSVESRTAADNESPHARITGVYPMVR